MLHYAAIVQTSVPYVPDFVQEILNIQKTYALYVQKFVRLVLKNVRNMLLITKAAKLAPKLARNVPRPAHNK